MAPGDQRQRPALNKERDRRMSFMSFKLSDIESISDRDLMGRRNGTGAREQRPSPRHAGGDDGQEDDGLEIAKQETSNVKRLRRWLLGLLVVVAAITCFCAYWFSSQQEEDSFRTVYRQEASRVKLAFFNQIQDLVYSAESLAVAYEAIRLTPGNDQTWPNITLPQFQSRVDTLLGLTDGAAQVVAFAPFIPKTPTSLRAEWEAYANENQDVVLQDDVGRRHDNSLAGAQPEEDRWTSDRDIFESILGGGRRRLLRSSRNGIDIQKREIKWRSLQNSIIAGAANPSDWELADGIFRVVQRTAWPDPGPGPFFPLWQTSDHLGILYNQMSSLSLRNALTSMEESMLPTFVDTLYGSGDQSYNLYRTMPRSMVLHPIIFRESDLSRSLLGSVTVEFDWHSLLSHVTKKPLDLVLESSCDMLRDPLFTFTTKDETGKAVFGNVTGDFHELRFDGLKESTTIEDFREAALQTSNSGETPTSLNCAYQLHIYPTSEYRSHFSSSDPIVYSTVVAAIFILVSAAFLIYDWVVEKRTREVMETAARTSAIVHNLFPQQVRERMFKQKEAYRQRKGEEQKRKSSLDHLVGNTNGMIPLGSGHQTKQARRNSMIATPKIRLRNYLSHSPLGDDDNVSLRNNFVIGGGATPVDEALHLEDEPIADLFPSTTVMFADIAGFTAWSSEREPSQVFKLLESLYRSFDEVANRLGVFKVETIGDCYVAVTGLYADDERINAGGSSRGAAGSTIGGNGDHAVIMARFAFECLYHMHELTKKLEAALGPGTTDLALRVGLHSGPVTAGVLRGEKSRFQLFGDTVNTAARMESTGQRNRIQVSEQTADFINQCGKSHWLNPRSEMVTAKGKGTLKTYWLKPRRGGGISSASGSEPTRFTPMHTIKESRMPPPRTLAKKGMSDRWADLSVSEGSSLHSNTPQVSTKKARLVNWNVDLMLQVLTRVVARRKVLDAIGVSEISSSHHRRRWTDDLREAESRMVLDEVTEIIELPKFDVNAVTKDPPAVVLGERVKRQLRDYITRVAALYHEVPFHNFEHASHVTMSAHKLLKRIIRPEEVDYEKDHETTGTEKQKALAHDLHYCSFGISSDPVTQLAIVFSALIHDVDHTGLPNSQLVKERNKLAIKYRNKSVAEQNSVDIAWSLLMEPKYDHLRECIWANKAEKKRFRQLVVNCIMATDIMDKEQQMIRKKRWDRAFLEEVTELSIDTSTEDLDINRKATSAIEHVIQASDVAHTMQHWRIYSKWNERLFQEMYAAYKCGRASKDPSVGWYEGEIWFFDNYIIPLARKLKECGVFGVAGDEYLNYALENRREWEEKGRDVCKEMLEKVIQLDMNARTGYNMPKAQVVDHTPLHSQ